MKRRSAQPPLAPARIACARRARVAAAERRNLTPWSISLRRAVNGGGGVRSGARGVPCCSDWVCYSCGWGRRRRRKKKKKKKKKDRPDRGFAWTDGDWGGVYIGGGGGEPGEGVAGLTGQRIAFSARIGSGGACKFVKSNFVCPGEEFRLPREGYYTTMDHAYSIRIRLSFFLNLP